MTFKELLKLIWKYLKPHKRMVYFCVFLAILSSGISAFIPLIYGQLVDNAVGSNPNLQNIFIVLVAWLIFVLLASWADRFVSFQGNDFGMKGYNGFLLDSYNHYLQLPLSFHKDKKSGEQIDKIDRAANGLLEIIGNTVFYIAPAFLTAIIAIVLMFLVEWKMTVVILIILFFYSLITIKKTKPIIVAQKKMNKSWENIWGRIYDSTSNVDIIKSHANEQQEIKTIKKGINIVHKSLKDFWWCWRKLFAWQDNIQGISFVLIFGIALFFLIQNQITAGILVSFVGYFVLVFRPFNQLANNYSRIQRGIIKIDRAVKLFDIDKELYDDGDKLKKVDGKIEFKNVHFTYDKKHNKVLHNVNFTAEPGEIVALVGESGAGKTTLLSLISRYYKPLHGKILLDNKDLEQINLVELRSQIGIVPQEVSLFNETLKNNLQYARKNATEKEIINALKLANAWGFVNKFPKGLKQKVGERGIKLSTGQKQRVAIARVILRNPKILILDEATSALDSISEKLIQEALKTVVAGRTTFVIAHRLSTIMHADKILVFKDGQIVEQGNHDELIKIQGEYFNLYEKQKF